VNIRTLKLRGKNRFLWRCRDNSTTTEEFLFLAWERNNFKVVHEEISPTTTSGTGIARAGKMDEYKSNAIPLAICDASGDYLVMLSAPEVEGIAIAAISAGSVGTIQLFGSLAGQSGLEDQGLYCLDWRNGVASLLEGSNSYPLYKAIGATEAILAPLM
jgi:hypothetical protein